MRNEDIDIRIATAKGLKKLALTAKTASQSQPSVWQTKTRTFD